MRKTQSHLEASVIMSCPQYDHAMNKVTNPGQSLKFSAPEQIPNSDDGDDDDGNNNNNNNNIPNKTTQYESKT
jgi:hypothetical protein